MSDEQLLLALKKISLIVGNLDARISQLEGDKSPIIDDLSNLRWYLSLLEKTKD